MMNDNMSSAMAQSLRMKAQQAGDAKVMRYQSQLAQILSEAAPDGDVQSMDDGRVILRARRIFARMMRNDKLRTPVQFLSSGPIA